MDDDTDEGGQGGSGSGGREDSDGDTVIFPPWSDSPAAVAQPLQYDEEWLRSAVREQNGIVNMLK